MNDPDTAFALAQSLRSDGRFEHACRLVFDVLQQPEIAADQFWRGCLFLEESGRHGLAFDCWEARIATGDTSPASLGNSARLAMQVGRFDLARQRYLEALAVGLDPHVWKVAQALATCQRYTDPEHSDIALFNEWLSQPGLAADQRAGLNFAIGKVNDDLGRYRDAAKCWRKANELMLPSRPWDEDAWQRVMDMVRRPSRTAAQDVDLDWVPVFVVGLPRSGTTLLAELLSRHAGVCNRGELMWIPQLFEQIVSRGERDSPDALRQAAADYRRMVLQDDAKAHWYIDKQNFNFLHVGLIAAMFPQAQVIYCTRDSRDTALSIWSQSIGGAGAASFMYAFDRIARVSGSCRQLMAHWQASLEVPIHTVLYEELVASPGRVMARLCQSLGIEADASTSNLAAPASVDRPVATASMWQVRQPVSARSVGRWKHYAEFVPELLPLA